MQLGEITVNNRCRKDLGDLDALAASMRELGLLQPIVINAERRLVAGQRRLEAAKLLGWQTVPVHIVAKLADALLLLKAERDENLCRKDFTPEEAVAQGMAIAEALRPKVRERQSEGGKTAGRGRPRIASGESPEANGDRHSRETSTQAAAAVGMGRQRFERADKVVSAATRKPKVYGRLRDAMNATGNVNAAYKELRKIERQEADKKAVKKMDAKSLDDRIDPRTWTPQTMQSLLPQLAGQVDAIVTDPPYSKEHLPLYADLARLARSCLKPDGILAVMCGHLCQFEIHALMSEHLPFRWPFCYLLPGGQSASMWHRNILVSWKPILVFGGVGKWTSDLVRSDTNDNDKRFHKWGQSEGGWSRLVERLTEPGQLVCDPFLGGSTTAVACLKLGRRFVGCDVDKAAVAKAKARVLLEVGKERDVRSK